MFQIKWLSIFLFIFSILAVLPSAASAQQPLTYGDTANGSLSAAAPVQIYTFNGETGDFITVQVITLSPGLQPTLSVIAPTASH